MSEPINDGGPALPMSKPKCCKRIFGHTLPFRGKPCSRDGVIERDGSFYCRQHDPTAVSERQDTQRAKYQASYEERLKTYRLHAAAPDLLEALQDALEHIPATLQKRAIDAINKAKGIKP